jgi:hypothetical protein
MASAAISVVSQVLSKVQTMLGAGIASRPSSIAQKALASKAPVLGLEKKELSVIVGPSKSLWERALEDQQCTTVAGESPLRLETDISRIELIRQKEVEEGKFTRDELLALTERKSNGLLKFFSSVNGNMPYPYSIKGVKPDPEAILKYYVQQALGLPKGMDALKWLRKCATGENGSFMEARALHLCAFLKLLGDGNKAISDDLNTHISQGDAIAINPVPIKNGQLVPPVAVMSTIGQFAMGYEVKGDVVSLDRYNELGERRSLENYQTSRTVTVFKQDVNGEVEYVIKRKFEDRKSVV